MTEPPRPDQEADQFGRDRSAGRDRPGPSLRRTVRSAPGRGMRLRRDAARRTPRLRYHHPARQRITGPSQPSPQRHGRCRWPRRLGLRACRRLAMMGLAPRCDYPATPRCPTGSAAAALTRGGVEDRPGICQLDAIKMRFMPSEVRTTSPKRSVGCRVSLPVTSRACADLRTPWLSHRDSGPVRLTECFIS